MVVSFQTNHILLSSSTTYFYDSSIQYATIYIKELCSMQYLQQDDKYFLMGFRNDAVKTY